MSNLLINPYRFAAAPAFTLVGATTFNGATSYGISWPSGTAADDLALFFWGGNSSSFSASGITELADSAFGSGHFAGAAYKVLTSGDVSSMTITNSSFGGSFAVVFRGPTVMTQKATANSTGASVSLTGFTKDASSLVVLAVAIERDMVQPDPVSGWTSTGGGGTSTYFAGAASYVASSGYTNSASVTQPLIDDVYAGNGKLFELT